MKAPFRSRYHGIARWSQRGVERVGQALRHLQRLLVLERQPEALALIPIRAVQPHPLRQQQRHTWRD
ncbi:MAG: hypothetical protein Q7T97_11020 [Burkholderiaceae bacterium]|nr:hypothetical protein [Burkholderiaceae bacterium]